MFESARIKLTAWYSLIIILISVAFSVAIYRVVTSDLDRVAASQRSRIERRFLDQTFVLPPPANSDDYPRVFFLDPQLVDETKSHFRYLLIIINLIIFGTTTIAGYFLAERTLHPIKLMVDDQNRFVTDASHELRTPLTSLKSEIEVNLRDKKMTLSEAKRILQSNLEDVNNLQYLSDGLIKLTQYRGNNNNIDIADLSLRSSVEDAVKKVNTIAKNKNIGIENQVKDIHIEASKVLLTEMFVIFLDNAIKYSSPKSKITLDTEKTDGYVILKINDQGSGIDPKDIPHLFDRFYRADRSRSKTDTPGYGLGLSIAKQIIDRHFGSVKVTSVLGTGTSFVIQLPVKHKHQIFPISKPFLSFLS